MVSLAKGGDWFNIFFSFPITLVLLWMEPALCKLSAEKRFGIMWVKCLLFKGLQFAYSTKRIFLLFGQDQWKLLELPPSQPFKKSFLKRTCQATKGKNQQVEHATKYKEVKNNFKSCVWNFQSLSIIFIIYVTWSLPPPLHLWGEKDENLVLKSKFLILFPFELCITGSKIKLRKW